MAEGSHTFSSELVAHQDILRDVQACFDPTYSSSQRALLDVVLSEHKNSPAATIIRRALKDVDIGNTNKNDFQALILTGLGVPIESILETGSSHITEYMNYDYVPCGLDHERKRDPVAMPKSPGNKHQITRRSLLGMGAALAAAPAIASLAKGPPRMAETEAEVFSPRPPTSTEESLEMISDQWWMPVLGGLCAGSALLLGDGEKDHLKVYKRLMQDYPLAENSDAKRESSRKRMHLTIDALDTRLKAARAFFDSVQADFSGNNGKFRGEVIDNPKFGIMDSKGKPLLLILAMQSLGVLRYDLVQKGNEIRYETKLPKNYTKTPLAGFGNPPLQNQAAAVAAKMADLKGWGKDDFNIDFDAEMLSLSPRAFLLVKGASYTADIRTLRDNVDIFLQTAPCTRISSSRRGMPEGPLLKDLTGIKIE